MERHGGQITNFKAPSKRVESQLSVTGGEVTRFKFSKILTNITEIPQYSRTGKALMVAGMSLEHLVSAAEDKGDKVERIELDAELHDLHGKVGEIIESADRFQAWQENGEVLVTRQLPVSISEPEIILFENPQAQKIGVVEGVGVIANQPNQANQPETNPYLQVPADLKKAA